MKMIHVSAQLSDKELLAAVKRLAEHERVATADLIATLAELDTRRLYLGEGCSSLFSYCTHVLHLSEHAAYGRIEAARAARKGAATPIGRTPEDARSWLLRPRLSHRRDQQLSCHSRPSVTRCSSP